MPKLALVVLVGLLFLSPFLFTPLSPSGIQVPTSHYSAANPAHSSGSRDRPAAESINVYRLYSSEPAPMGIADYGVGSSGAYQYSTSSFLGVAQIHSLQTQNSTGDPTMSIQLNVNLQFASASQQYVYWIQDVATLDTSKNQIYFIDNIWNSSGPSASIVAAGISGNGDVANCNCSSNASFYYYFADNSMPGNGITYSLPMTLQFKVNSTLNSRNEPVVSFAYNDGSGWQTYDSVTFLATASSDSGFVVNGFNYNPANIYYDAELILGGAGNAQDTSVIKSDIQLQLQYWNGHNYQGITNAYNFGSDTAETIDNALAQWYYYLGNGSSVSQISPGAGVPGKLFYRSQIGIVSIISPFSSGTLYVVNSSGTYSKSTGHTFVNGNVTVTLYPGNYIFYLYDSNGALAAQYDETVTAGGYISLHVTSSSYVTMNFRYSSVGGIIPGAPTLTYYLNGQRITTQLTNSSTYYYMDPGSVWNVTGNITISSKDRWQTNSNETSGIVNGPLSIDLTYYHQYLVKLDVTLPSGSGSLPSLETYQFGSKITLESGASTWADANSSYSLPQTFNASSTQRWEYHATMPSSGVWSEPTTVIAAYIHQFYIVVQSAKPTAGTVTPSSGWYNESSSVTLSEVNNSGWGAGGWIGKGPGSYSGNQTSVTIVVAAPITESAVFLPALTLAASNGGSVKYTYGTVSGTVPQGSSKTIYVPEGTTVTLDPKPVFLYSFDYWKPGQVAKSLSFTMSNPVNLKSLFKPDYVLIGVLVLLALLVVSSLVFLSRRLSTRSRQIA
ncbi:MAG: thermopsin [Nitrososphaerota archaeon]|nr:thermopsin [Nitrososphaerota archaeon]